MKQNLSSSHPAKEKKEKKDKKEPQEKHGSKQAKLSPLAELDATYEQGKVVGGIQQGGEFYSVVKEGKRKDNGQPVLIRNVQKAPVDPCDLTAQLRRQILALRDLSHPRLVKLLDAYEDENCFVLVVERFADTLAVHTKVSEAQAKSIILALLDVVQYLHSHSIWAGRVELRSSKLHFDANHTLKLDDVGLDQSTYPTEDKLRSIEMGPQKCMFMAPEMLTDANPAANSPSPDLWAVGVLTYMLLSGSPPFDGDSEPLVLKKVSQADVQWPAEVDGVARQFVAGLLVRDPAKRFTLEQMREHPWLKSQ